jgi:hypothetical protein
MTDFNELLICQKDLTVRIAEVEKNLAIFAAGEQNRIKKLDRIERAIYGINGDNGIKHEIADIDHIVKNMKDFKDRFVKIIIWVTILIIAPLFGSLGFLTVKILAHIDTIIAILDKLQ